jgi:subtilisin-like proprotein convertase family protein
MTKKRSARTALLACAGIASLGLIAGAAPAAAKSKGKAITKTVTQTQCGNTSVFVPDRDSSTNTNLTVGAGVNFQVPKFRGKPQDGVVSAVNDASIRVTSTYSGDLILFLVSPGGKAISLSSEDGDGSNADGYGTGSPSCSGNLFHYSDSAGASVFDVATNGEDPLTGTYRPMQPLSTLAGGPARGTWTLVAYDDAADDTSTINAVSVTLTYSYKALKKVKKKKKK